MKSTAMRKLPLFSALLSLFLLVPASITRAQTITSQKGLREADLGLVGQMLARKPAARQFLAHLGAYHLVFFGGEIVVIHGAVTFHTFPHISTGAWRNTPEERYSSPWRSRPMWLYLVNPWLGSGASPGG